MSDWLGLPPDWSLEGHHIDRVLVAVHVVMAVLFVGWFIYFAVALVRFRAGKSDGAPRVEPPSGRFALAVAAAIGLLELVVVFAVEVPLWARRYGALPAPESSTVVRVVGEQFVWNFHYPGADGKFGKTEVARIDATNPLGLDFDDPLSFDDVITINQLHVPLGKPVLLELGSKDVIHSFSINYMRVKQDAIPGQRIRLAFTPTTAGSTDIGCAQLCGLGHYRMRGELVVENQTAFDAWYQEQLENM